MGSGAGQEYAQDQNGRSTNQPTALKVSLGIVNPESGDVGVGGPVIRQEVDLIILCASGTFARST